VRRPQDVPNGRAEHAAHGAARLAAVRPTLATAKLYAASIRRALPRAGLERKRLRREERLVFVVGCPRSGTTFFGGTIGGLPGFVDLGEVAPLKPAIPQLQTSTPDEAAAGIRTILERVRRLSLVTGLRAVEQTPEVAFVLGAALRAYPQAKAIHVIRDGRDVVCSLLERGWLSAGRAGRDDAGQPYGAGARFWVEPERRNEFEEASDAARAAWAWRRYVTAARSVRERTLEVRYESLAREREAVAEAVAAHLGVPSEAVLANLRSAHARSIGRFERDLGPEQLADVEREAGPLLRELGYRPGPS
jgi:Sulfotransferase family